MQDRSNCLVEAALGKAPDALMLKLEEYDQLTLGYSILLKELIILKPMKNI